MQIEPPQYQDQLVRGLAHRMNNILTLFHSQIELLLGNEKLDQPTRDGLLKILEGAHAASALMERAHFIVRPSTLVWRQLELAEFVPMLRVMFEDFRDPLTELVIVCDDDLPQVWADAGRLRTAILELVRNACEAAAQPGGVVRIEVRPEHPVAVKGAPPTRWISITITDNGPGIDPELGDKIFQPFFTTKTRQNATGLGLNVATGLVQQLGGTLRYESEPGKTCFQVLLPARGRESAR